MKRKSKENERLFEERLSNQGCLMKIVKYNGVRDVVVEFQDEYKAKICTQYCHFLSGEIRNPYCASIYGVGIVGNKYSIRKNNKLSKEYYTWVHILERCFDKKTKQVHPTYKDSVCCKEWLLYENFYEWLHNQDNFDKWLNGNKWAIDKDILVKGNKIYSPETCCLVPQNVNNLFVKCDAVRGDLPIGVTRNWKGFQAKCINPFTNKVKHLGMRYVPEAAFNLYKKYKENVIKQIAQIEFDKDNITKRCYEAMMNYQVEITD